MSKEDLKIKPVDQELTKEDLRKVNGGTRPGGGGCSSDGKPCKRSI